ncbi:MAG: serine/threonine protein kinase [Phycisphaerae bacterium]|nr:serine/threonine protein kinase [Phycisphaerae bacterium]
MDTQPPDNIPDDLPDRVDRALAALWHNDSGEFDGLLEELSSAGTSIGAKLQAAVSQGGPGLFDPSELAVPGYRVIREIGRGGMGVVFEAEQMRTQRLVALKVIREAHALDDYHRRLFEREVRTLARLRHPHIAAVYDAGATEAGHPFFAMELVRGQTLTGFASAPAGDGGPLSLRDRLRLFQRVCQAVSYAHQRGVIHRDLKPSNVLVVEDAPSGSSFSEGISAEVKVLDFGLARIVDDDSAPLSISLATGRIRGTLAYASPEQARGEADHVDTRSDVYSLGVMLYQLVAGRMPYDLRGIPLPAAIQRICEQEPATLTVAPASESALREKPLPAPAELRTIVQKTLAKEPERRYAGAAALAEDIERFLLRQPILAQPPGLAYIVRKFLARHRVASVLGGVILFLLVSFTGYASIQASRLARQRDKAVAAERLAEQRLAETETARDKAKLAAQQSEAVSRFLEQMLASPDPTRAGRDVKVVELLDRAAEGLREPSNVGLEITAVLHLTLGRSYRTLGVFDRAKEQIDQAVTLFRQELGDEASATLQALNERGVLLQDMGEPIAAEKIFRNVLAALARVVSPNDSLVLAARNNLALVLQERGDFAEAEPLFRNVLSVRRATLGEEHEDTLESANNLAGVLIQQGRWKQAEPLCRQVLERQRRTLGNEHPDTLVSLNDLALLLKQQGRINEAEPLYREALAGLTKRLGEGQLDTLITAFNLATVLRDLGKLDEAAALGRDLLDRARGALPPDSWYIATFRGGYGKTLLARGEFDQADIELKAWYDGILKVFDKEHPYIRNALLALIELNERRDQPDEVERYRKLLDDDKGKADRDSH